MSKNYSFLHKVYFLVFIVELGVTNNVRGMSSSNSTRSISPWMFDSDFRGRELEILENVCCASELPKFSFHDHSEEESELFKHLIEAAEKGNSEAQYNLGNCYEFGYGCKRDEKKAIKWYTKSADQGFPEAQFEIGLCYLNGRGVKINGVKAFKWLEMAALQRHAGAQCDLGYCFRYGIGVEQNETEADMWFTKAALQGDWRAKSALTSSPAWFFHWVNNK